MEVVGGLVVVGGTRSPSVRAFDAAQHTVGSELFDEASGRWFELPHQMAQRRMSTQLVPLPAAALAAPAAAASTE